MIVTGTNLFMTRGDSEYLLVSCPDRPFREGDKVELTVRRVSGAGPVLLHKETVKFTRDGRALLELQPEDTAHLPFCTASYDVQATFSDLGIKTLVRPSRFEIGKEESYGV